MPSAHVRFASSAALCMTFAVACGSSDGAQSPGPEAGSGGAPSTGGASPRGTGGAKASGGGPSSGGRASGGAAGSANGGASGSGGTQGSGGRATGGAGSPSTGGANADAGKDASVGPTDARTDAPNEAGVACAPGGSDGTRTWHDFASGTCKLCPSALPTCDDLLAAPGPTYDATTRTLVFHLTPGTTELVTARFVGYYIGAPIDGGTSLDAPAVIDRNTLTVDLSSQLPSRFFQIDGGIVQFTDACGQSDRTDRNNRAVLVTVTNLDGGGQSFGISCYDNV